MYCGRRFSSCSRFTPRYFFFFSNKILQIPHAIKKNQHLPLFGIPIRKSKVWWPRKIQRWTIDHWCFVESHRAPEMPWVVQVRLVQPSLDYHNVIFRRSRLLKFPHVCWSRKRGIDFSLKTGWRCPFKNNPVILIFLSLILIRYSGIPDCTSLLTDLSDLFTSQKKRICSLWHKMAEGYANHQLVFFDL